MLLLRWRITKPTVVSRPRTWKFKPGHDGQRQPDRTPPRCNLSFARSLSRPGRQQQDIRNFAIGCQPRHGRATVAGSFTDRPGSPPFSLAPLHQPRAWAGDQHAPRSRVGGIPASSRAPGCNVVYSALPVQLFPLPLSTRRLDGLITREQGNTGYHGVHEHKPTSCFPGGDAVHHGDAGARCPPPPPAASERRRKEAQRPTGWVGCSST